MKFSLSLLVLLTILGSILPAHAQRSYRRVVLDRQDYVPLYDCSIFRYNSDRNDCRELARSSRYGWDDGYAVSCDSFRRGKRDLCLDLAASITYNENAFDCTIFRGDRLAMRDCMITRRSYARGEYDMSRDYDYDRDFDREFDTYTTVTPVTTTTAVTTCGPAYYDSSYQEWLDATRRQRRRGNTRRAIGIGATILGAIISGNSRGGAGDVIGGALMVGGVTFATLGMIDLAETRISMPHLRRDCSTNYVQETRYVVVNRERCRSVRYTERGYGSSRSYYETTCSGRSYVTYKRFDAWESSNDYGY